jgi:hypothetical protein
MAKKKAAVKKSLVKKTPGKKTPNKKSPGKKAAAKKSSARQVASGKKTPSKPVPKKRTAPVKVKKQAATPPPPERNTSDKTSKPEGKKASASLGRPLVTAEEKLYLLFKEDYHARQVFDFLRVETVRELEQFTAQEIVHRLSHPVRQTVEGIRRKLAEKNRCLAGDEDYALKHRPPRDGEGH